MDVVFHLRLALKTSILVIMQISTPRSRIVAVLGPTNTGKTYLALERMLGHGSGMMGFPLRLLARENYDRAVKIKGARQVALITGEEKIVPPYAKYFFCTVESMPLGKSVAFMGIDEIQLCGDPDRGHIFTDRILYARGTEETMFMGADTVRPLLKKLVPEAEYLSRPRFSALSYSGAKNIGRMSPRSAVVGFSTADVYAMAEILRRQRGGAAIVMGALSPRTRNAQVQMFQAGEVDHLVATDAIGMGLNLELDHVAFASTRKFDGHMLRNLRPDELGQIAGRAGRHMSNGTFGTTADAGDLAPEIIERIENHRFDAVRAAHWRNPDLDFSALTPLRETLDVAPTSPQLVKVRQADDERFLDELAADPQIAAAASTHQAVSLLWEVCQIPDFRKTASDSHVRLLAQIYRYLSDGSGQIPTDWIAKQVSRIDLPDGDIDTLVSRIANIRIWTYVSHRAGWLSDPAHWQERTRDTEDRLSDALHGRLTQRFVDKRATALVRGMRERDQLRTAISADGDVEVEGHFVGRLEGFKFTPDRGAKDRVDRTVTSAALRALSGRVGQRARELVAAHDDALSLDYDGSIRWRGDRIARLKSGLEVLRPDLATLDGDLLETADKHQVETQLRRWLERRIARTLTPLVRLRDFHLKGPARGIAFQLVEGLGAVRRERVAAQIRTMPAADFGRLRGLGVRIGRDELFVPAMLKPAAAAMAALLWTVHQGRTEIPDLPPLGRASFAFDAQVPRGFIVAVGYRPVGDLALRIDIIERLHGLLRKAAASGTGIIEPSILNLAGCSSDEMEGVLRALGYRPKRLDEGLTFKMPKRRSRANGNDLRRGTKTGKDSPFAKLKDLAAT